MENILLVFGGKSYEHDISIVTASQIYNKTKIDNFKLIPLYISKENKFYVYLKDKFDIKDFSKKNNFQKNKNFKEVIFVSGENNKLFVRWMFGIKEFLSVNYAIFACHGGSGENGKLVSFFENFNIFSSAGQFDSLAICMNKFLFKQVMHGLCVPVVRGFLLNCEEYKKQPEKYKFLLRFLKFPVVIKPNNGGSSIGMFVAYNKEEFGEKILSAFEFDENILVERYVSNTREFNIAIVGTSEDYELSEIDEPLKEHEILSFSDKYLSNNKKSGKVHDGLKNSMVGQSRKFPADIPETLRQEIVKYAKKIFSSLNLSGIVRIDFLWSEEDNKLYVCEVNAIPGSLAFYFFKENKILVNNLVKKLVNSAKSNEKKSTFFKQEFTTKIID